MGIDPSHLQRIQALDGLHQARPLLPGRPQAGHAGVQFQVNRQLATTAAGQVLAEEGLAHAAEGGHQLPVQAGPQFIGMAEVAQHQDGLIEPRLTQLHSLLECGDTEAAGAASGRRAGDGHGPMAVSVGLDHGHQGTAGVQGAPQGIRIGLDRRFIDFHPGPLARMGLRQQSRGRGVVEGSSRRCVNHPPLAVHLACIEITGLPSAAPQAALPWAPFWF